MQIFAFFLTDVQKRLYNFFEVRPVTLFDQNLIISYVRIAIFVPLGSAKRMHTNRKWHGFAFNLGSTTTYTFSTGKVLTCQPGQCIFLPKGSTYTVNCPSASAPGGRNATRLGTYAINFLFMDPTVTDEPFILQPRGKEQVLSCFTRAEAAWQRKAPGFQDECFSVLYQLLRLFRQELSTYTQLDGVLAKIAPALQYIDAYYPSQPISIPHLAHLCGISEPHLRKLFNAAFSVSPSVYVRNLRLNYAKELLRTGEYSVTSVAMLAGFNSTNYFTREFKKATGVAPSDYHP